ncbi:MAG: dihydropteridine reductase [Eubacterium sp.]
MNTDKIYAQSLANEYAPKDTSKVVALKKLDKKAKAPANIFAYTFGCFTALVFGLGMCLTMNVIGTGSKAFVILGIIIGIIGFIGMGVNYSIYKRKLEAGKKKYAFEIMELAREISEAEE